MVLWSWLAVVRTFSARSTGSRSSSHEFSREDRFDAACQTDGEDCTASCQMAEAKAYAHAALNLVERDEPRFQVHRGRLRRRGVPTTAGRQLGIQHRSA